MAQKNGAHCISFSNCISEFCNAATGLCEQPDLGDTCSTHGTLSHEEKCKRGTCDQSYVCKLKDSAELNEKEIQRKKCGADFCRYSEYCNTIEESPSCLPKIRGGSTCHEGMAECDHGLVCFRGKCTQLCFPLSHAVYPMGGGKCSISSSCMALYNQPHIGICMELGYTVQGPLLFQKPLAVIEEKGGASTGHGLASLDGEGKDDKNSYEPHADILDIKEDAKSPKIGTNLIIGTIVLLVFVGIAVLLGFLITQIRRNRRRQEDADRILVSPESEYKRPFGLGNDETAPSDAPPSFIEATEPAPPAYDVLLY